MTTEAKWTARVEAWRASGQSVAEFCEGKEYAANTLRYWSSLLRRRLAGTESVSMRAGEVRIARVVRTGAETGSETPIVVELGGARVHVRRGFDAEVLRQVMGILGGGQ